jgi:type II secretory pathway component PulF
MPTFEYAAVDASGNHETGTILGKSLDDALAALIRRGLTVERIGLAALLNDPLSGGEAVGAPGGGYVPRSERPGTVAAAAVGEIPDAPPVEQRSYVESSVWGPLVGKVPLNQLAFFFRQFSTMLDAGVPMVQSLDTLSRQARDLRLRRIVSEIRDHVKAGRPVSFGMQRYPEQFSPLIVSLVRAGEEGGFLDTALAQVADYLEHEIELRNLYRRVTFYPKLVLFSSVLIVLATNAIIASLGKQGGLSSPLTTPATWILLGPLLVGLFLFLRVGLANPRVKYNWDMIILMVPYIGGTIRQLSMSKFGRAFGALYRGGVPMTRSLQLAADSCGNEYLRARIHPAARVLETGAGVSDTLEDTRVFSPIVIDMVRTGETTGNLDTMLTKMSQYYEDEGKTRAQQTGQVVGVAVYLLVALYVGYIVLQFYSGYFGNLSDAL